MIQALGYVTKTDNGGFKGVNNMLSLRKRIENVPNRAKETDRQPDFRVYTEDRVEIGGGWNKVGQRSGRPHVSLTFAHPDLGRGKLYANLGLRSCDQMGQTSAPRAVANMLRGRIYKWANRMTEITTLVIDLGENVYSVAVGHRGQSVEAPQLIRGMFPCGEG